jgi:hypothetical protein
VPRTDVEDEVVPREIDAHDPEALEVEQIVE